MNLTLHSPEILPGVPRRWLPYDEYIASNGDGLLWEPTTLAGQAICLETDGPFCHVAAVVKVFERPCQGCYQEGLNGYLSPLSAEVRRHPGKISVFRPHDPEIGRPVGPDGKDRVAFELFTSLGGDYAWENIQLIYETRSPGWRLLRWLIPALRHRYEVRVAVQSHRKTSAICSQAFARAWASGAQIELVPGMPLALVTPNDIARGCAPGYLGTLTWPAKWKDGPDHGITARKGATNASC